MTPLDALALLAAGLAAGVVNTVGLTLALT